MSDLPFNGHAWLTSQRDSRQVCLAGDTLFFVLATYHLDFSAICPQQTFELAIFRDCVCG